MQDTELHSKQYETEMDRKFHAHMILAEKKDELWDLCQKFIDKQGFTSEKALKQWAMFADLQRGETEEFLIAVSELVGYSPVDLPEKES